MPGHIARAVSALAVMFCAIAPASAQQPLNIQPELLSERRERPANSIRFCINPDSITANFDRAVGEAIAQTLVLDVSFYALEPQFSEPLSQRILLDQQELYIALYTECDALLGYAFPPTSAPGWMTLTQPYYRSEFVLATNEAAFDTLGDIPATARIGTRIGSRGDGALLRYRLGMAREARWQRLPYADNGVLLERLGDGTIAAALIWAPALARAQSEDLLDYTPRVMSVAPMQRPFLPVGLALLTEDSYLRTLLDDAIAALEDAGVTTQLLDETRTPGATLANGTS